MTSAAVALTELLRLMPNVEADVRAAWFDRKGEVLDLIAGTGDPGAAEAHRLALHAHAHAARIRRGSR
jgi:CRISPR/Cas system-associated exonuclease Cas4 (RecB family)